MTAMMAFFLVMWLLSLIPQSELTAVAEYFRMPLTEAIRGRDAPGSGDRPDAGVLTTAIPEPLRPGEADTPGEGGDQGILQDLRQELDALIDSDPVLNAYRPQLLLDMTPDGLRIQIVDQHNRPMFALGSARMQADMSTILRSLASVFNRVPNRITLAGHTDAVQYVAGEREYSNWELSADRANAARRELVAGGMDESRVKQVLGLSSTVSLIKDNPDAAVNRRISIVVLSDTAEERMDRQLNAALTPDELANLPGYPLFRDGGAAGVDVDAGAGADDHAGAGAAGDAPDLPAGDTPGPSDDGADDANGQ